MNGRRFLTAPLLASALAAVVAMPAVAAPAPLVAGGSFARTIPFIDGTLYTFECHAAAPGAASTTVRACTLTDGLHNIAAPPATTLGQAAVTTETVATTPLSQWRVCWTASSTYGDGTSQSTSGCTTASSIAGAG